MTPRPSKLIEAEIDALAAEARGIIDKARSEHREPNEPEGQRFDVICKTHIPALKAELARIKDERRILDSPIFRKPTQMSYIPPSSTYNQANTYSNQLVLPTNGRLPGETRTYSQHVPVARLRGFSDVQTAIDGGRWLQAMHARWGGGYHDQAEEHCRSVGLDIQNAMSEGSGSSGGYLTPAPIASMIIAIREKVGITRKALTVLPTDSDTLTVPKRATGVTVYAPGEGNAITASDPTVSQVELILKKRAAYSELSQELSDDSIINLADYIFTEFAYALALQEDNELINGTGAAATYFGVRGLLNRLGAGGKATSDTGDSTWDTLDLDDFAATMGLLPDRYFDYGVSWICSYAFYNSVMVRLAYSAGGAMVAEMFNGTGNERNFLGYPVLLTSQMPTTTAVSQTCALFGAFSQAGILADRGPIRLARSDDFKFQNDLIAFRATSRYDINVHDPGTASAAGAYVGLVTAAS